MKLSLLRSFFFKAFDYLTTKKYDDEYLGWLRYANAGMLNSGNVYLMKYAIERLPSDDPIIEIGSFCGLSTNVITYFLRKNKKKNILFCSDKWIFEGSENGDYLGKDNILRSDYKQFVKDTFARNINFFSPNLPYPIELTSDEFFDKWTENAEMKDIFNRSIKLGGKVSFCYVDGNHTYKFVKQDFENIDKHLLPGGFILFDDTSDADYFGLKKLMTEIKKRSDYELIMKNPNYLFKKKK